MCLDERGVSRSDLKPSQRCALRNSGGMFLVLASLSSPVSLFSPSQLQKERCCKISASDFSTLCCKLIFFYPNLMMIMMMILCFQCVFPSLCFPKHEPSLPFV